jgi:hypothetical protein
MTDTGYGLTCIFQDILLSTAIAMWLALGWLNGNTDRYTKLS